MKINEIIQEGPINAVKGLYTDYKISQMGAASVKLWKKYLNSLEAKNNYEPLTAQQLEQQFTLWADQNLLGKYSINNTPNDFKQMFNAYKTKVGQKPRDNNLLKSAFTTIIDGSRKLGLDPNDQGNLPTPQDCKVTSANNKVTVCGQEINPATDKQLYDKLKDLLAKQGRA